MPPLERTRATALKRFREVPLAKQRLQDPVGRDDERKRSVWKWQGANVAAHKLDTLLRSHPMSPLVCTRQHLRRAINADDAHARAGQRKHDPPGPGAQLEDRAGRPRGDAFPERDVATSDGLRVLPIVERCVLVPALPTLGHQRNSKRCQQPATGCRRLVAGGPVAGDFSLN